MAIAKLDDNLKVTTQTRASENPYLSGNFAPMIHETTAFDLQVRGRIPDELEGRFTRIGPSPLGSVDPARYHWFAGTGLVHGLRLRGGHAEWYRSRFTLSADAVVALGRPPIPGPGEGRKGEHQRVGHRRPRPRSRGGRSAADRIGLQLGERRPLGLWR